MSRLPTVEHCPAIREPTQARDTWSAWPDLKILGGRSGFDGELVQAGGLQAKLSGREPDARAVMNHIKSPFQDPDDFRAGTPDFESLAARHFCQRHREKRIVDQCACLDDAGCHPCDFTLHQRRLEVVEVNALQ